MRSITEAVGMVFSRCVQRAPPSKETYRPNSVPR